MVLPLEALEKSCCLFYGLHIFDFIDFLFTLILKFGFSKRVGYITGLGLIQIQRGFLSPLRLNPVG